MKSNFCSCTDKLSYQSVGVAAVDVVVVFVDVVDVVDVVDDVVVVVVVGGGDNGEQGGEKKSLSFGVAGEDICNI